MNETDFEFKSIEPGTWTPEKEGESLFGVLINEEPRNEEKDIGARYYIENDNGITMVWGSAILDDSMKLIKKGTPIRIVYKGTKKSQKGRDMKVFDVQVAKKRDTSQTAAPAKTPATTTTEETV